MSMRVVALAVTVLLAQTSISWAQTKDTVRIGVLTDMSSTLADSGGSGSVEAAKMAVEDFGGSVLGSKIEVVSADHQNKADIGAGIARKWYDAEGVDAIVDLSNSSVALAVLEVSRTAKKLALISGAATADITGPKCSPYAAHWMYDTYSLAHASGSAVVKGGGDTWFFVTADYAFGHSMQKDAADVIQKSGGKVLGNVLAPVNTSDYSSFLLQAQSSHAKVVALATGGADTVNAIKQAAEFGIVSGGQKLVSTLIFISDVHSLGLASAQGLQFSAPFYWDLTPESRAFSKRFFERTKRMPTMEQAGVYSSTAHYLKAVKALGSKNAEDVIAKMREMPINDPMTHDGKLRIDGRVERESYLFEVKKPSESKEPWDYYKKIGQLSAQEATRPLSGGNCPLVK
jgi:branched-chain amino acid transport system substrate-binding protein